MSLRLKIVAALVLLATCATAAVGISSYVSTRHELNEVVDRSLRRRAANPCSCCGTSARSGRLAARADLGTDADGDGARGSRHLECSTRCSRRSSTPTARSCARRNPASCRSTTPTVAVANGIDADGPAEPRDVTIDGEAYRMLTIPVEGVGAVQIARSAARDRAGARR